MTAALLPPWLIIAYYAIFGLVIGSFLNVVIARVPAGESLTTRSHCPRCGHPIRNRDNIPLLSWLLLRARCRDCGAAISWRYPTIELVTGFAFAAIVWRFNMTVPTLFDLMLLGFAAVSIVLAVIDIDTKTLPDSITIPTFFVAAITVTVSFLFRLDWSSWWKLPATVPEWSVWQPNWAGLAVAAASAAAFGVFYFLVWFITSGRGLGYGDVKLAPTVGVLCGAFGVESAVVGFFAPFILGGIPLALLLAAGIIPRGTKIPYGPLLLAGGWVGIMAGEPICDVYLSVAGLR